MNWILLRALEIAIPYILEAIIKELTKDDKKNKETVKEITGEAINITAEK